MAADHQVTIQHVKHVEDHRSMHKLNGNRPAEHKNSSHNQQVPKAAKAGHTSAKEHQQAPKAAKAGHANAKQHPQAPKASKAGHANAKQHEQVPKAAKAGHANAKQHEQVPKASKAGHVKAKEHEQASTEPKAGHKSTKHHGTAQRINLSQFSSKLAHVRAQSSSKECAKSVRIALQSAGAKFSSHPVAASDWGATLKQIGYRKIKPAFKHPKEGDIYIIPRTKQHVYGHIAGFSGSAWVSDFQQKSHTVYQGDVEYEYYRLEN